MEIALTCISRPLRIVEEPCCVSSDFNDVIGESDERSWRKGRSKESEVSELDNQFVVLIESSRVRGVSELPLPRLVFKALVHCKQLLLLLLPAAVEDVLEDDWKEELHGLSDKEVDNEDDEQVGSHFWHAPKVPLYVRGTGVSVLRLSPEIQSSRGDGRSSAGLDEVPLLEEGDVVEGGVGVDKLEEEGLDDQVVLILSICEMVFPVVQLDREHIVNLF